jgi:hypothetical protein
MEYMSDVATTQSTMASVLGMGDLRSILSTMIARLILVTETSDLSRKSAGGSEINETSSGNGDGRHPYAPH